MKKLFSLIALLWAISVYGQSYIPKEEIDRQKKELTILVDQKAKLLKDPKTNPLQILAISKRIEEIKKTIRKNPTK